jgi:hypothetical protein
MQDRWTPRERFVIVLVVTFAVTAALLFLTSVWFR